MKSKRLKRRWGIVAAALICTIVCVPFTESYGGERQTELPDIVVLRPVMGENGWVFVEVEEGSPFEGLLWNGDGFDFACFV